MVVTYPVALQVASPPPQCLIPYCVEAEVPACWFKYNEKYNFAMGVFTNQFSFFL